MKKVIFFLFSTSSLKLLCDFKSCTTDKNWICSEIEIEIEQAKSNVDSNSKLNKHEQKVEEICYCLNIQGQGLTNKEKSSLQSELDKAVKNLQ